MPARQLIILVLLCSFSMDSAVQAQRQSTELKYGDWLVTDGNRQLYKIRFNVFLPNGHPAKDLQFQFQHLNRSIDPRLKVVGNLGTAWLPVLERGPADVLVTTKDGKFGKRFRILGYDLRHFCETGVQIELESMRTIRVTVTDHKSNPIAGAKLIDQNVKTDKNGLAIVKIPADENPARFMVVAPSGNVARMNLYETPEKRRLNKFTVQTLPPNETLKQEIQLVNQDGQPVSNLIISPQPRDRAIDVVADQGFPIISDHEGKAKVTWIPGLPGPNGYIDIYHRDWIVVGDIRKPKRWTVTIQPLPRKKITGKIELPTGVQGGFAVQLTSYDHPRERRSDQLYTRSNEKGEFVAHVLPGAAYCAFVVDARWSSSFWDGVPVEKDGSVDMPKLKIEHGVPIKIIATQGPDKTPIVDAALSLERKHLFRPKTGRGLRTAGPYLQLKPDKKGVTTGFAVPGEVTVTLRSEKYRDSKTLIVKPKGENIVEFHHDSGD